MFDLYQHITDQIVSMLDRGVVPWRCPILGQRASGQPKNLDSRKAYRGVNVFLLAMPEPTRYTSSEEYYSVLFHELAHSTGHSKRLDRKLDTDPKPFGSSDYGREELIAEMASAFLCGHAGIQPAVIENQASYIGGWLKTIRSDKRLLITAAGAAQKAADFIRGLKATAIPE